MREPTITMIGMRALVLDSFGPPPRFGMRDVPPPSLKPGSVRLRVHAVGFGFPDALMIAGKYQSKSEPPFTPGNEVAGVVTEVVRFDAQRQLDRRCPSGNRRGFLLRADTESG